ncbi:MAG: hypothetical protein Tsb0032_33470 [Kiloniellaceae bacterium]
MVDRAVAAEGQRGLFVQRIVGRDLDVGFVERFAGLTHASPTHESFRPMKAIFDGPDTVLSTAPLPTRDSGPDRKRG